MSSDIIQGYNVRGAVSTSFCKLLEMLYCSVDYYNIMCESIFFKPIQGLLYYLYYYYITTQSLNNNQPLHIVGMCPQVAAVVLEGPSNCTQYNVSSGVLPSAHQSLKCFQTGLFKECKSLKSGWVVNSLPLVIIWLLLNYLLVSV